MSVLSDILARESSITITLLSRQNQRNLCYGPILVTGILRNFYWNYLKKIILLNKMIKFCILPYKMLYV